MIGALGLTRGRLQPTRVFVRTGPCRDQLSESMLSYYQVVQNALFYYEMIVYFQLFVRIVSTEKQPRNILFSMIAQQK